jgi:hypothetical protein
VGTILEGKEELAGRWWGESRIVLTAIGEEGVLAREIARRSSSRREWREVAGRESFWMLLERDWRAI